MITIDSITTKVAEVVPVLPLKLAQLVSGYAESDEARIARLQNVITSLNSESANKPKFEIVSGTLSNAAWEEESIGVALPDKTQYGLTVKCGYFGMGSEMIRFFQYLAKDSEITSFMPVALGGGYLEGADEAIAECLRKNRTLEVLDVHYCDIGEEGVLNIVNALAHNTTLKYLNIRANGINNGILNRLIEVLKTHNRALIRFSFTQDNFTEERNLDKQLVQQADALLKKHAGPQLLNKLMRALGRWSK